MNSSLSSFLRKALPLETNQLIKCFFAFIVYLTVAKVSMYVYFAYQTSPALIWPTVGLAIALMVIWGYSMWLPIFVGHLVARLTVFPDGEYLSLVISLGYAIQSIVALYVFNRLGFKPELEKLRNMIALLLIAFLVTMIQPTITTAFQLLTATIASSPLLVFARLWAGGIFSVIVFTPFLLSWLIFPRPYNVEQYVLKAKIEISAAFIVLFVVNHIVFWTEYAQILGIIVIFIIPAVLVWFALRIHPQWLSLAVFITALQGVTGALFANHSNNPVNEQLLSVQLYVGLVAAIFFVFAAVVEERRNAFKRLEEALSVAAASDKAKNEFIAILAHELRNPLAPVISSLELLKLNGLSDEYLKIVQGAQEHTVMMRRLLDDLLDIARLGQNKIQLHKEASSILQIIQQALASVEEKARTLHHTIDVVLPGEDFIVFADPVRIKQIIINLVNNALKYTNKGGKIQLRCEKRNGNLVIQVSDTGIGIAEEKLEKIFEPFKQLSDASRYSSGLGIGLFLTRQLTELHDGTVEVRSAGLGKGSVFTVTIPLLSPIPAEISQTPVVQPATPYRILVVDDNKPAADILQKLLRIHKHETDTAYSGKEALSKLISFDPNIIFLDIGMPDMSGYEVAEAIRKLGWKGTIIALSGYGQDSDKLRSAQAGFDHHLVKPVGIEDILKTLSDLHPPLR